MHFKRIVIFGGRGMMGRYATKYFSGIYSKEKVVVVNRAPSGTSLASAELNCDANQPIDEVNKSLETIIQTGDLIINCIGMTNKHSMLTEKDELTYYRVNSVFPRLLGLAALKVNAYVAHISTDCVYTGRPSDIPEPLYDNTKYIEGFSMKDAFDMYGFSKALGDCSVSDLCNTTIFRTSIIGEEDYNHASFVEWVLQTAKTSKTINGFVHHYWNGITCLELCKRIDEFFDKPIRFIQSRKIVVLSSPEFVSKYELIEKVVNTFHLSLEVVNGSPKCAAVVDKCLLCAEYCSSLDTQLDEMYSFDVCNRRS